MLAPCLQGRHISRNHCSFSTLCGRSHLQPHLQPYLQPVLALLPHGSESSLRTPWLQSMAAPSHGGAEPDSRSLQVCYMRASDALQELYANLREDQLMLLQVATAIWRKVRAHLLSMWAECCAACWLNAPRLQLRARRLKLVRNKARLSG